MLKLGREHLRATGKRNQLHVLGRALLFNPFVTNRGPIRPPLRLTAIGIVGGLPRRRWEGYASLLACAGGRASFHVYIISSQLT